MKTKQLSGRLVSLLLCTAILFGTGTARAAGPDSCHEQEAKTLKTFDLFLGTQNGFELERVPTRAHGAVLLVRLLGEEEEALAYQGAHPFTDVPAWCDRYIAYAYNKGYLAGTSASTYGPDQPLTCRQYTVFLLRALGYRESAGDFTYGTALETAHQLGLGSGEESGTFTRGDAVHLSYQALQLETKQGRALLTELFCKHPSMRFLGAILESELAWVLEESGSGAVDCEDTDDEEYIYEDDWDYEDDDSVPARPSGSSASADSASGSFVPKAIRTERLILVSRDDLHVELCVEGDEVTLYADSDGSVTRYSLTAITRDPETQNPRTEYSDELRACSGTATVALPSAEDGRETGVGLYFYYGDDDYAHLLRFLQVEDGQFVIRSAEAFNRGRYAMGDGPSGYLHSRWGITSDDPRVVAQAEDLFSGGMSDYEKGFAAYRWICENISYNRNASHYAGEVLDNRQTLCQGYANLMAALLNVEGIPARVIVGESLLVSGIGPVFSDSADATNHAWVQFYADGRWVICDPTAGGCTDICLDAYFDMEPQYADSVMKALYIQ